jgi:hypothetical protein
VTSACHAAQKAAFEIVETERQVLALSEAEVKARGGKDFLAPPTAQKIVQVQRFYKMLPYLPVKHLMKHRTTRTATGIKLPDYTLG